MGSVHDKRAPAKDKPLRKKSETRDITKVIIDDKDVSDGFQEMAKLAPGRTWLGQLEGNGGRDVMIYLPSEFRSQKPYEIDYFFHGTDGHIIEPPLIDLTDENFGKYLSKLSGEPCVGTRAVNQVLGAVERSQKKGDNTVLVYPLSEGSRGTRKMQDLEWMSNDNDTGDNMLALHQEVIRVLKDELNVNVGLIGKVAIKGHSAGGVAINNILASGFLPDRVDYLDATYWEYGTNGLRNAYKTAIKANPEMEMNIFVHDKGKKTDRRSRYLRNKLGVQRIDARGIDFEGHKITHEKMMRNYWSWDR